MTEPTPSPLLTSSSVLIGFARAHHDAAQRVGAHTTAADTDTALLTPTFGIIGAEFLATLNLALHSRATRLTQIAATHHELASRLRSADDAYTRADDSAEMELTL
ncbi:MAG: type VII secretion target [Gordonia sp. (in: high G+C Gram-positive bacteria)]